MYMSLKVFLLFIITSIIALPTTTSLSNVTSIPNITTTNIPITTILKSSNTSCYYTSCDSNYDWSILISFNLNLVLGLSDINIMEIHSFLTNAFSETIIDYIGCDNNWCFQLPFDGFLISTTSNPFHYEFVITFEYDNNLQDLFFASTDNLFQSTDFGITYSENIIDILLNANLINNTNITDINVNNPSYISVSTSIAPYPITVKPGGLFGQILSVITLITLLIPIFIYLHFWYIDKYKWRNSKPSIWILIYTITTDTIIWIASFYWAESFRPLELSEYGVLVLLILPQIGVAYLMSFGILCTPKSLWIPMNQRGMQHNYIWMLLMETIFTHYNIGFGIVCFLRSPKIYWRFLKVSFDERYFYFVYGKWVINEYNDEYMRIAIIIALIPCILYYGVWIIFYCLCIDAFLKSKLGQYIDVGMEWYEIFPIIILVIQEWIVRVIYMMNFAYPTFDAVKEYWKAVKYIFYEKDLSIDLIDLICSFLPNDNLSHIEDIELIELVDQMEEINNQQINNENKVKM